MKDCYRSHSHGPPGRYQKDPSPTVSVWEFLSACVLGKLNGYLPRVRGQNHWKIAFWCSQRRQLNFYCLVKGWSFTDLRLRSSQHQDVWNTPPHIWFGRKILHCQLKYTDSTGSGKQYAVILMILRGGREAAFHSGILWCGAVFNGFFRFL